VIYRVAQEALTNVQRHADASLVWLTFFKQQHNLRLLVGDNGRGFPEEIEEHSYGIRGIRERVDQLGGKASFESRGGGGAQKEGLMSEKIRLLLVDDQRLMRDGLRTILELEEDLAVVAEAENGLQAIERYREHQPDVVLMDIRMPEMDGVEATTRLQGEWPDSLIIILTTFDDDKYIFEALRAGALGYLLKDVSGEELAAAIRTVQQGGALIEPSVARKMVAEFARLTPESYTGPEALIEPLSEREEEILRLLAQGLSNKEIALRIHLAEGTVKNYISAILAKIGARDRTQAALRAKELGLI
jgi:DNA-binding NarL/FixJ family response regulator